MTAPAGLQASPPRENPSRAGAAPTVSPIAGALGAEIGGVDLARPLGADITAAIRRALLDYLVVFFRGQDLTPARLAAVARQFGTPIPYPYVKGLDEEPLVIPVVKREHETVNFGGLWHSDTAYLERPPLGTMLYAREVPVYGGDTLFANMYLAWEALSDGMKAMLAGLRAVNASDIAAAKATRPGGAGGAPREILSATHPVARVHPETGRRALYVNRAHTRRFAGFADEESAPLLAYLFAHQTRPEFTCRFRWTPGALAFWDNRCAQHNPVNDYHGKRRAMLRVTLEGDRPAGADAGGGERKPS